MAPWVPQPHGRPGSHPLHGSADGQTDFPTCSFTISLPLSPVVLPGSQSAQSGSCSAPSWWLQTSGPGRTQLFWGHPGLLLAEGWLGYLIHPLAAPAPLPAQGGPCPRRGPRPTRQQRQKEDHVPAGGSARKDGRRSPWCWWGLWGPRCHRGTSPPPLPLEADTACGGHATMPGAPPPCRPPQPRPAASPAAWWTHCCADMRASPGWGWWRASFFLPFFFFFLLFKFIIFSFPPLSLLLIQFVFEADTRENPK